MKIGVVPRPKGEGQRKFPLISEWFHYKGKGYALGIHDDHRQRVYNRFLREGLEGFEEHNAMEFLLFLARARGDTNPLAHALIDRFGSVADALDAPIEELMQVQGIGETSATVLKFIPQMCAYYLQSKNAHKKLILDNMETTSTVFLPKFMARTTEALYIALVNDRRELLRLEQLSEGTYNATPFPVDKLVKEMTYQGTSGFILAHNHPHGLPVPSAQDMAITRRIYRLSQAAHVSLLDHLIFADGEYVSMQERGLLPQIIQEEQYVSEWGKQMMEDISASPPIGSGDI